MLQRMLLTAFRHKSILILVSLTLISSSVSSGQTTRPRRVATSKKAKPAKKEAPPKPKPLTAKDYRAAEERLAELSYWTGAIDGKWDDQTRQGMIAFQKISGLKRTGALTRTDYEALMAAEKPAPREKGPAHVEVDLDRQVLFLVDDEGVVGKILPVSTGSGKDFTSQGWTRSAITPPGHFKMLGKIAGWKKSPLGRLYYPNYFLGGMAIHGYPSVPTQPASHGCIRIPMFAAVPFARMTKVGMGVLVHNETTPEVWNYPPADPREHPQQN
jgi:N-acetylmuramoyl-L-alanine amidase